MLLLGTGPHSLGEESFHSKVHRETGGLQQRQRHFIIIKVGNAFFCPLFRITRLSSDTPGAFPGEFLRQRDLSVAFPSVGHTFQIVYSEIGIGIYFLRFFRKIKSLKSLMAATRNDMSDFSEAMDVLAEKRKRLLTRGFMRCPTN